MGLNDPHLVFVGVALGILLGSWTSRIVLFLAAVGLHAGDVLLDTLPHRPGRDVRSHAMKAEE